MKRSIKGFLIAAMALFLGIAAFTPPASAQEKDTEKLTKHFNYMDKNKDGVVTEDEFKIMGKDYKQNFQEADTNKDGKMTMDEYMAWKAKQKSGDMSGMKM